MESAAEIVRIHHVADIIVHTEIVDLQKVLTEVLTVLFIRIKADDYVLQDFQIEEASVLSAVYLHAIRIHMGTRHYFVDRPSYRQLQPDAYLGHKKFLLLFENGGTSFDLDSVRKACGFTPYSGDRSVTKVVSLNLIPGVSLPRKESGSDPLDSLTALHAIVSDAFVSNYLDQQKDPSVIFIDFMPFDRKNNTATVIDFHNRMVLTHRSVTKYIPDCWSCSQIPFFLQQ